MKNMTNRGTMLGILAVVSLTLVIAVTAAAQQGAFDPTNRGPVRSAAQQELVAMESAERSSDALMQTNCRYGVGNVMNGSLPWVETSRAGWYLNFTSGNPGAKSAEFVPVLNVSQDFDSNTGNRLPTVTYGPPLAYSYLHENGSVRDGLGQILRDNPGQLVLVGNEVDVDNIVQGNTMPDVYARAYHEAYEYIKAVDPTAKVAIAGLSMMTEGRVQYLDIVWDTYKDIFGTDMPVDVWNMHLYILHERVTTNPDYPNADVMYGDGKVALGTDPLLAKISSHDDAALCPDPNLPDTAGNDPRADVYCRSEHDSVRIFQEQVLNMRQWMKDHGQQNKPLIISEFGLLYPYLTFPDNSCDFLRDENGECFDPDRVTAYMDDTLAYLETAANPNLGYPQDGNKLVQQWLWYSLATLPEWSGGSSNLIECNSNGTECVFDGFTPGAEAALTQMGVAYRDAALSKPMTSNLVAGPAANVNAHLDLPSNKATATLSAVYRNAGNGSIIKPFKITFYSDAALTKVIGTVDVTPENSGAVAGCTWGNRYSEQASVTWSGLSVGTHSYWAVVDSGAVIGETSESDNTTTRGTVTVLGSSTFVPVVNSN